MKEQFDKIFRKEQEFDEAVEEIFAVVENENDPTTRNIKVQELISKVKRAYIGAHYDAITDALTGCFNKKHIKEMYHHQYAAAKRNNQYFSLAAIDIDYLKYVNDTFGHATGDEVIKNIADKITKSVRENDLIFRYGGDEFVLFCLHNNKAGMKKVSSRIHEEISGLKIIKNYVPSVTIGYTTTKPSGKDNIAYADLFKEADEMLYQEKHSRKSPDFIVKSH
jgi:diguanylate cyclase (GGDEF)-like protein